MDSIIEFEVIGLPKPWKRPVRFAHASGKMVSWSPKDDWFSLVHGEAVKNRPAVPLDGPLHMDLTFRMPKPKSARKTETFAWKKPDLDNLCKAVLDACNNAQVWVDDARVVSLKIVKLYGEPCGADIAIWQLGDK